jgi:hypothetical protein
MNEASGSRADSFGGFNLTDNNTVGSAAGKIALAADFISANVEALSNATTGAPFNFQDTPFTVAGWYSADDQVADKAIVAKDNVSTQRSWLVLYSTSATLNFYVFPGPVSVSVGSLLGNGTLHFFVAWHDAVADTINLQVDNGTVSSTALVGGATSSTAILSFGAFGSLVNSNHDGKIDEVGCWSRLLTASERTSLYNSGTGITYPFVGT